MALRLVPVGFAAALLLVATLLAAGCGSSSGGSTGGGSTDPSRLTLTGSDGELVHSPDTAASPSP